MKETVLVGMSGGVDSSVAAVLLREQGYDVEGVTLRLWDKVPGEENPDIADARAVCGRLGIPHHVPDLRELFRRRVVDVFAAEYAAGRTPNPCILCNRGVKLGAVLDYADRVGAAYVATGHYARVAHNPATGRWELKTGLDPRKDQSYVLYALTQGQLSRLLLPLGSYGKEEIRALAREHGLAAVADKADSQDICFIPDGDHPAFLERWRGEPFPPGQFVDEAGRPLGLHRGIGRYTVGQRKGLGIALGQPMFVSRISARDNTVTLVAQEEKLFTRRVWVGDLNLVALPELAGPVRVEARVRYSQGAAPAALSPDGRGAVLLFDRPQRAPTPGQGAVFYRGDVLLGGGTITEPPDPAVQ